MSYYDDASLMFLAGGGAQKDGKAYSVKPVPVYGSEEVTNGDFATDSDWTKTNSVISGGVATITSTGYGYAAIVQNNVLTIGKTYKATFDINSIVGGLRVATSQLITNSGIASVTFTATYTYLDIRRDSSYATTIASIDNVSVKEVLVGDGDFTFSRGSNLAATRVGAGPNYYIEKGRENVLLQSNQFDTTWLQNRIDLTSGQSGYDGGSDAWKLESNNASTTYLSQNVSASGVQTASVYAKAGTANYLTFYNSSSASVWFNLSNGSLGNTNANIDTKIEAVGSDGWYRCSMTFNVATSYLRVYVTDVNGSFPSAIGANILIQDAQLESGLVATDVIETTTTTGTAGILENTPRFNYSNGASCPSLLLEPSRTNLFAYSEYYAAGQWANTDVSLTTNYALSPEGKMNASLWEFPTTNIAARIQYVLGGVTAGVTYTQSYYIKSLSGDLTLRIGTSGAVAGEFEDITATSEWKRFDFTSVASGTTEYPRIQNISGTQGAQILVYGAQMEQGSYPTSYIPNHSGGTITRAADVCGGAGDANTFNSTEGVLYFEVAGFENANENRYISLSDGTSANSLRIFYYSNGATTFFRKYVNSVQTSIVTTSSINQSESNKIAIRYNSTNFDIFSNGIKISTNLDSNAFPNNALNVLNFTDTNGVSSPFLGNVKQVLTFNTALSDADLATLTTI